MVAMKVPSCISSTMKWMLPMSFGNTVCKIENSTIWMMPALAAQRAYLMNCTTPFLFALLARTWACFWE